MGQLFSGGMDGGEGLINNYHLPGNIVKRGGGVEEILWEDSFYLPIILEVWH